MENALLSDEHLAALKSWLKSGSINIFGLPFAGKDTHGHTLAELFGAPMLSSGDIFRNSVIPPHAKAELDAGRLVPSDDFVEIITPYLSEEKFAGHPLILSSVGRWIGEEEGIIGAARASGHPIKAVIYLHLSEEIVYERFKKSQEKGDRGNRADDAEHKLETRINEFNEKTLPVIEVYRKKGLLIEVNSDAPKHEVAENILARLLMCSSD